ncbi:MAG: BadF/BadG/BcrA/BcrD ATPase family protein, partial [Pseudomonadota bacterium]
MLDFLQRIRAAFPSTAEQDFRCFITGSGAGPLVELLGAEFVQEVNAVQTAVAELHPDVGSVIELGGQDAKIIIFQQNPATGEKHGIASMNDKCASGTGATIDKCMVKAGISPQEAARVPFNGEHLHHVAAKCGVFAETDIVNLVKSGVPADEILCSLANAIVSQNLSVLTRGKTLRQRVLLLGGPNTYLPFLQDCWRTRIPEVWDQRGYDYPADIPIDELIFVPQSAELYAALGAALFGQRNGKAQVCYRGEEALHDFISYGRAQQLGESAGPALAGSQEELAQFRQRYAIEPFRPPSSFGESVLEVYLGLDGGSTSSKCVAIDRQGNLLLKSYRLSRGNPLEDMKDLFADIHSQALQRDAQLVVKGLGVTGYAGAVIDAALQADVNVVETVAHQKSAARYFPTVDVVCDIGGQDIKVLITRGGELKDFRLSNQCSAGNGMLLQAMADQFGLPIEQYADHAFAAELSPEFSYGCAVFLDADRVNFQKEGFGRDELMAGLARVLPKNVWQYVA